MSDAIQHGWRRTNLGALAKRLVNGGTPPTDEVRFWQGKLPWITGADFTDSGIGEIRRFVSEGAITQTATNLIERGQLLIVTRTGVGKLAIAPTDIAISQDITGFYIDRVQATPEFLYHRLKLGLEDLKKLNQGTSINGITRRDLVSYPLDLPSLPQQRRIAEILTTMDEVIEATEKLVEKHQQIKAGLMHDLFTRGLWTRPELVRGDHKGLPCAVTAKVGQLRPTPEEAPGLYQDASLGPIPKVWEFVSFGRLFETIYRYPTYFGISYVESGVVEIRGEMLNDDGTISEEARFITPDTALGFPKVRLELGDVVMSVRGTIGKTGRVTEKELGGVITANMLRLKPNRSLAFPPWVFAFMRTPMFVEALDKACSQTTIKTIQMPALMRIAVGKPAIEEQESTCQRLEAQNALIAAEIHHLAKLRQQKQGLMHDLLTGRVQVE